MPFDLRGGETVSQRGADLPQRRDGQSEGSRPLRKLNMLVEIEGSEFDEGLGLMKVYEG